MDAIRYAAEFSPGGRVVLHLFGLSPAVERGVGGGLEIILVAGAVPGPWRRLPVPVPGAGPAPSVDLALLERTLREWFPGATGATGAEIAAAEERLGVAFPDELKVLYGVVSGRPEDLGDGDREQESFFCEAVGHYSFPSPLPLDEVHLGTASTRLCPWQFAALEAVRTPPDAAVQGLVGSPGWIVFGDGDGDRFAVDLTPGPRGHTGQVIMISRYENTGGELLADSLTSLVTRQETAAAPSPGGQGLPMVARVNEEDLHSVQAVANPDLEVLSISEGNGEPFSLAPVRGLPRLRTLTAFPGTLADPLEIADLVGLEFLELGPEDWRVLLDSGAVPRSLLAAAVTENGIPAQITAIANELLALWDRPPIVQTVIEGLLA